MQNARNRPCSKYSCLRNDALLKNAPLLQATQGRRATNNALLNIFHHYNYQAQVQASAARRCSAHHERRGAQVLAALLLELAAALELVLAALAVAVGVKVCGRGGGVERVRRLAPNGARKALLHRQAATGGANVTGSCPPPAKHPRSVRQGRGGGRGVRRASVACMGSVVMAVSFKKTSKRVQQTPGTTTRKFQRSRLLPRRLLPL